MFRRIGAAVARHPIRVIAIWMAAAIGLIFVGQARLYDVTTSDQKDSLSSSFESVRAADLAETAFGKPKDTTAVTALVRPRDRGPLDAAEEAGVARLAADLVRFRPDWHAIGDDVPFLTSRREKARAVSADPGVVAPDRGFQLVSVEFLGNPADPATQEAFKQLRAHAQRRATANGLSVGFTGGVATWTDRLEESEDSRIWEQALLYGGIVLLALLIFRGVLSSIVPLLAVFIVAAAASGVVVGAADVFGYKLDANTPQLVTTVLIGIGIDYFLFLLFRHRERLRAGDGRKDAAVNAMVRVGAVIASAALAVVVAFASLGLAEFGQFKMLGPSVALSVLVMLVAGLTLFPAIVALTGRFLYWPSRSWRRDRANGPSARLGSLVARRPAVIALAATVFLAALGAGALGARLSFDPGGSEADTPASRVADEIDAVLPAGAKEPVQVFVRSDGRLSQADLAPLTRDLAATAGVAAVGTPRLNASGQVAQIDASLGAAADSRTAMDLVRDTLRRTVPASAPVGSEVLVGGIPAVYADVERSVSRDLRLIFPVAAALILLILVLLLRSVVAPLYLLVAVALEFAATFGAAVLVFQHGFDRAGVAFTLPIVLYLFVVALGTDYNMLIASRLREERKAGASPVDATANAVRFAAPAMGAAGLALAVSFGSLMLYPDESTRQIGFAMAIGILIAAFVVSSLLVPAVTALLGERAWWPSRRSAPERHLVERGRAVEHGSRA